MKRRLKILLTGSAIGLGTFAAAYILIPQSFVPQEFSAARIESAKLAERIVANAEASLANLQAIAEHDRRGRKAEALTLVAQEFTRTKETQDAAVKLSSRLEAMARGIDAIKPEAARLLATEAVSAEVALVSRLISYNSLLQELFGVLREKFERPGFYTNGRVEELVAKVNEEARAINDFNRRSTESLAEFDKLF
ncbi:MAG: hypothetical protein AAB518_00685 [Patescibacteria group bacterium]